MAKVSSGNPFPDKMPRHYTAGGDDHTVMATMVGNRVHNTFATEADYDRAGELGSMVHKRNALRPQDWDDDLASDGHVFERNDLNGED